MKPAFDLEQNKVLDAASELFERYGYKKTTVDDIAQEAGISKGAVYLRFASKEEIGLSWLSRLHQDLYVSLTSSTLGTRPQQLVVDFLIKRVMSRFDIFHRHRRSLDEALSSLRPLVEERKRAFHELEAQFLVKAIVGGVQSGDFESSDPESDARSMIVATNSLLPYNCRPDQIGDRETVLNQARALAQLLARSLRRNND